MLFRTLLAASLLASLAVLPSHAQTAPATSRFYVGLAGNQLSNIPFNEDGIVPRIIGPALVAGLQLTPRLAVQTGLSYHWKNESYTPYLFNSGTVTVTNHVKYFLVPALLRYMATAPTGRAHFDVLGGATIVHATGRTTFESNSGVVDPALRDYSSSDTRFNLTLGPAVRAAITPQLEFTAAGLVSMVVGEDYYQFSDRLFLNTSIGLNYTFGQR